MKKKICLILSCALLLAAPSICSALVLVRGDQVWQVSAPEITTSLNTGVYVWENGNISSSLFNSTVDPSSAGITLYATPSDVGYNSFVNYLKDANGGYLVISMVNPSTGTDFGIGYSKSELPSLQGANINGLSLKINTMQLNTPGSDPNHNGIYTDGNFSVTLQTTGAPEPTPTVLLLIGFAVFSLRRKRKNFCLNVSP
ncbi:MAG: PEP-CTERM sorting domain-containing protein [Candidatus Staskawiczbacteria bacterium]|nr:PEP-CTERM sorting domain-containing protein [Candidatus Staskawiczbacteria bacterium]